jgi:hypothetical protein
MKEPQIEINGWQATPAMAMTIRVAIESFAVDLRANGLGDDEHGIAMKELYFARIYEIRELMAKER